MNLFRQLDDSYHHLAVRQRRLGWLTSLGSASLDDLVGAIRADRPDSARSDTTLRAVIEIGRRDPDALTVAMHALAPRLRSRLARAVTDDYRDDALTDLAYVLADSALDGPRLAARLVNRAHNRTHKAAQRLHTRGVVNVTTTTPHDPEHFDRHHDGSDDIATTIARRVDLGRFHAAVQAAIDDGRFSEASWAAYRDHRLRRAVDPDGPVCTNHERTTASRAVPKLQPLIDMHLHAA